MQFLSIKKDLDIVYINVKENFLSLAKVDNKVSKEYRERPPRIGVDRSKLVELQIDLEQSKCRIHYSLEDIYETKVLSIMNVAIGGARIVVPELQKIPSRDNKIEIFIPRNNEIFSLRGRIAWSELIAGRNYWIGIEMIPNKDWITFHNLIVS